MNDSWGYQRADDNWKTPKNVVRNLITCARDTGNYLLNIGPKADGSIPEESVRILTAVGKWMARNGDTIYNDDASPRRNLRTSRGEATRCTCMCISGRVKRCAGGAHDKVQSAKLFATGHDVKFGQDEFRVRFLGLPQDAPDTPVTTIAIECESEPIQNTRFVRTERPRNGV